MQLNLLPSRFMPSKDVLEVLNNRQWICGFSGGKDSTALVTWIEWLRRVGMVKCKTPRLVMSDTTVEYPFLNDVASKIITSLVASGWECEIVTPEIHNKLYNRIFGVGVTPVHPSNRKMRWCSRATKIDPMKRFARTIADDVVQLSGVRWGESTVRDEKLSSKGCSAGGECGLPDPGEGVFGPIITWTLWQVIDWLSAKAGDGVSEIISDLLPAMQELIQIYEIKQQPAGFFGVPPKVQAMRFGCIGCPAITRDKVIAGHPIQKKQPKWIALTQIWKIWEQLYLRENRCCRLSSHPKFRRLKNRNKVKSKKFMASNACGFGPIKMEARKRYFADLLDIQEKSGVTLVTERDIAFIHDCWEKKVYPRGWSEEDELVQPPKVVVEGFDLFDENE